MSLLKKPAPQTRLRIIVFTSGLFLGIISSHLIFAAIGFSIFGRPSSNLHPEENIDNAKLTTLAFEVLEYIRDGNFESLSQVAHPDFGVVFSPSATINLSANRSFSSDQIALFASDSTIYVWGLRKDTGKPIELTPVDYFSDFVFSADYINAPLIGVDRIVRSGNALENISEKFPGVRFVDFHIPGGERDTPEELDWSSLRLGFEEMDGKLWLIAIVHSTWTV